jgi:DNA invertase Pin-like site-specific DNA recombinase
MTVLAAVAEFERDLIRERVLEGLENAGREGSRLGRPSVLARPGFEGRWLEARMLLVDQQIGKREAARRLKVGAGTLERLLAAQPEVQLLATAEEALVKSVRGVPKTLPR